MPLPPALGAVMIDLEGYAPTAEEERRLSHPGTGGLILFTRNYRDPGQLCELVAAVRSQRPEILIAVDHEGGRVQRFREGFTRIPPAASYRRSADGISAAAQAETAGWLMAAELRACGIDFSFAPVLDVDSGISQVIGDRAFSDDPDEAAALALSFVGGMRRAGMAGVGKHFPGHGGVAADSHLALPRDERTRAEIEQRDLKPFRILIESRLEGIMPAHVLYPRCDERPAGFSPYWIRQVLRRELGFQGAVFSDDLSMAGAAGVGDCVARARTALAAGCDMVLVCNSPEQAAPVLDAVADEGPDADGQQRLSAMRGRFAIDRDELLGSIEWREAVARLSTLNGNAP